MDMKTFTTINALSDHVIVCEIDGIKVLHITHPKAKATISLFGGHLLSFQPTGKKETIWMSEKADFSGKNPLRGGIPICWPWFGKAALPSHGFARTSLWTLSEHRENDHGVMVRLSLNDTEETRAIWPHSFHVDVVFEITDTLNVHLISTNTNDIPIEIGGALHTYLNIGNIRDIKISGLGQKYAEKGECKTGADTVSFEQEIDRIYTNAEENILIEDPSLERQLKISNTGHNGVVLWNPWSIISTQIQDMPDDGYQTMVCVESCIYDRSVLLEPGCQHILSTCISSL